MTSDLLEEIQAHMEFTKLNLLRRYNHTGILKRKEKGLAIFNFSPSFYSPPFPNTFLTKYSGWLFYPLQRVSSSTSSLADKCPTSVSIFSGTISPNSPLSYGTAIIRNFFCIFSRFPWNSLHPLTLILLSETSQNKLGKLLCYTSANTWRWFLRLTGSTLNSFWLRVSLAPPHFHKLQNQIPLRFP